MSVLQGASASSSEKVRPVGNLQLSRPAKCWFVGLTVLILATWFGLGLHLLSYETPAKAHGNVDSVAVAKRPAVPLGPTDVAEGSWGRLEVIPITIAPPPEAMGKHLQNNPDGLAWHFPNTSISRLPDILIELGLPDPLIVKLKSLAEFNDSIRGYTVRPSRELVLGMTPEVRAKFYVFLYAYQENEVLCDGFRFCGSSIDQWFGDVSLLPETKRLVTPLIYRYGSFLFFSDLQTIEPLLPSAEERIALLKALSRESTLLLKLELSPDSDVEALVRYWGRGGREREVRPIIESLANLPTKQSLDVTQLLPPFARRRIYTYPVVPAVVDSSVSHDCHWSAFNFFSEKPDDRYGRFDTAFATFGKDYYRIFGNPQFGDLVLYVDDDAWTIHTAVYIAADIVFTKSGTSVVRPWMFMKLESMDDYYPRLNGLTKGFFRRKGM